MSIERHTLPIRDAVLPSAHEVDVWLVNLGTLPMMVAASEQTNVTHSNSLMSPRRDLRIRQQFFVRLLLGRYLDRPGKDIEIVKDAHGKPRIRGETLAFNLSHSGTYLAVAVGSGGVIGVDIEQNRPIRRVSALAKRCFSAEEANAIGMLDEPEASEVFLHRWTKTEALVKAQGERLATSLAKIRLSHPNQQLLECPKHWPDPALWNLQSLVFDAPVVAALASPEPILAVHLKQLDGV